MDDSSLVSRKIGGSPRFAVSVLTTLNEWHFTGPKGKESVRVHGRFSVNNPRIVRQAVLAGQGIAITPQWQIGDDIKAGKVKVILSDYIPTPLEIHAVYPDRRLVPAKVSCFIEYLKEKFEKPKPVFQHST